MAEIPSDLTQDGYLRTIRGVREALERRCTNATLRLPVTPSFHRGLPNLNQLPNESVGIWLDYDMVTPDPEGQSWRASCYQSHWTISIIARDEENDAFGAHSTTGEELWAAVTKTLTEFQEDVHLDGSVEYTVDPDWRHVRGQIGGGDKRIEAFEGRLWAKHTMEMVRPPPQT